MLISDVDYTVAFKRAEWLTFIHNRTLKLVEKSEIKSTAVLALCNCNLQEQESSHFKFSILLNSSNNRLMI